MTGLDKLLSQPLPAVADAGFSARVVRRARLEQLRRNWKAAAGVVLCIVLMVLVLPLNLIGSELGAALTQVAGSWALSLGAWLVVASLLAANQLSRM